MWTRNQQKRPRSQKSKKKQATGLALGMETPPKQKLAQKPLGLLGPGESQLSRAPEEAKAEVKPKAEVKAKQTVPENKTKVPKDAF